jgi:hypothetical protein
VQVGSFSKDHLVMFSDACRSQITRLVYVAAFVLFILSLLVPAVSISKDAFKHLDCADPDMAPGWFLLLIGPLGIFVGQFGWFANPLMLLSALPIRKSRKSIIATFAMVLAATSVTLTYFPNDIEGNMVCGFGPGLYLWLACPVLMVIATLLKPARQKDISAQEQGPQGPTS